LGFTAHATIAPQRSSPLGSADPGPAASASARPALWESCIVDDGDGAWIVWVDDSAGQQLRYGRLSDDGTLPRMSVALGQLDTSLGHCHTLQRVGQSAVALWTDTTMNRTFSAMRVCF
jgi:hypothetical protein